MLKQQLLAAVEDEYICSLQDALYGYANVTVRDIIVHLQTTYGQLDQDALTANLAALEVKTVGTSGIAREDLAASHLRAGSC